jgi:hypothetical protein
MKPLFSSLAVSLLALTAMAQTNPPPAPVADTNAPAAKIETAPSTNAPGAVRSNAVATAPAGSKPIEFDDFKVIMSRNIFDPSRSGVRIIRPETRGRRTARTDTIKLLGTMSYEKGRFAFFGGNSAQFRKTLSTSDRINEYEIADIGYESIKLVSTNNNTNQVVELKVGMGMSRQDNGPWTVLSASESMNLTPSPSPASENTGESAASTAATPEPAASGAVNDVLQRLMQKRAQQLSK